MHSAIFMIGTFIGAYLSEEILYVPAGKAWCIIIATACYLYAFNLCFGKK